MDIQQILLLLNKHLPKLLADKSKNTISVQFMNNWFGMDSILKKIHVMIGKTFNILVD